MAHEDLKRVFDSWHAPLEKWNMFPIILKTLAVLNNQYDKKEVFPPKGKVFRAFRETDYNDLKVIIMLQDPYHNGMATGIAIANEIESSNEYSELSPSLQVLIREWVDDPAEKLDEGFDASLIKWCHQGILMLNAALTVERNNPKSHIYLWRPFTEQLLTNLSKDKHDLVYVLLGKDAQSWKNNIINGRIIMAPHPQAENYSARYGKTAGFYGSRIFSKVNEALELNGKDKIKW